MVHQPWSDITLEEADKARQAGTDFGSRRNNTQKDAFIKQVIEAESSVLRIRILLGDAPGNAQKISNLFASAALRRWYEVNDTSMNDQISNIISFPAHETQKGS